MDIFRMAEVIPLLPLPGPPQGRSAYYVPCPKCDRSGRRSDKHLNINLSKDVFRCARCGWYGGIFDLYAFYTGTPRQDVREVLIAQCRGGGDADNESKPAPLLPEINESPIASVTNRHAAYTALLSMLSLAADHMRNLLERGLPERAIAESDYRTKPMVGGRILAKRLMESGCHIEGVPGFYKENTGSWTFIEGKRGILIPVRDIQGRIQGLQVRRDDVSKRKYRWVSSAGIESGTNGCGAEGWLHLSGPIRDTILLTEGPLKADIVHHLTGQTVLAVPGVNSLKHLEHTLIELKAFGVKKIMTAFDMDFLRNPHVQSGYGELTRLLGRHGFSYGTYLWRPDFNGLDDFIWQLQKADIVS